MPASPARSAATATRPTSAPSPTPGSSPQHHHSGHIRRRVGPRLLQQGPTAPHNTDTADTADTVLLAEFRGAGAGRLAYARARRSTRSYDTDPIVPGGFTRDDFTIDTDAQTVTCPAGHTKAVTSAAARFGALCNGCPLRARCTTSAAGRSVTVDQHHHRRQANKTRWAQPATQAAYQQHRPMAERSIAWLTRNKARRVPYRGVAANHLWLTTRAAAVNLVRLTNLGVTHNNGAFTL